MAPRRGRGIFRPRPNRRDRRTTRPYKKHGLTTLKRAVQVLGNRALDRRTSVGKTLAAWRADLIADLGGPEAVSTQQTAVVDLVVKTRLLVDSVDAWLLRQPTLVHHRRRALLPVVLQRQQLADALARMLGQLGLERRKPPPMDLQTYLASTYGRRTDYERVGTPERDDRPDPEAPPAEGPESPAEAPGRRDW